MTVNIINSACRCKVLEGIVLNENDFHPCRPFFLDHPNIKPESINKIYIHGIFERHPYIRCVLRYCDYILASGALLEIDFYSMHFDSKGFAVRSANEWMAELSLVFGDRILLINTIKGNESKFVYKKLASFLPSDDSIDKWSFGIVSDGRKNERILSIISQIAGFQIPQFEVIICGPKPSEKLPSYVRVLDDTSFYLDKRIPIAKKKNYIIEQAQYNNLVIMHDRISFSLDWYEKMLMHGNYYDYLCFSIVNENDKEMRMIDWSTYDYSIFRPHFFRAISYRKSQLLYSEWKPTIYVNGGFYLIKRHIARRIMLNPNLHWGEKEDVDFSVRSYSAGVLFELYPECFLFSLGTRFNGSKVAKISLFSKFKYVLRVSIIYLIEFIKYKKYLSGN